MRQERFRDLIAAGWKQGKSVCVGLDSAFEKLPEAVRAGSVRETMVGFNRAIVEATKDLVLAYKPNTAFYEAHGDEGIKALRETIQYIRDEAAGVPVIVDAKRADIGNTNLGYVDFAFGYLQADAVTLHPYLGREALAPFLSREEKGCFILCRTSNGGAGEFQDLTVGDEELYKVVARRVANDWNALGNCGLVVGATYPEELRAVRAIAPALPILVPGIGAQDGDLEQTVRAGKDADGAGIIISASRSVIFASSDADFADAARREVERLSGQIRAYTVE